MAEGKATIRIGFGMVDDDWTAKVRDVAGHCRNVAAAWESLAYEMDNLADSFDRLTGERRGDET